MTTIIEREKGDGLVNGMVGPHVENPFWEQHLRKTYPEQFETNDHTFRGKTRTLEELREVQNDGPIERPGTTDNIGSSEKTGSVGQSAGTLKRKKCSMAKQ